jgi:hypothetical protein
MTGDDMAMPAALFAGGERLLIKPSMLPAALTSFSRENQFRNEKCGQSSPHFSFLGCSNSKLSLKCEEMLP